MSTVNWDLVAQVGTASLYVALLLALRLHPRTVRTRALSPLLVLLVTYASAEAGRALSEEYSSAEHLLRALALPALIMPAQLLYFVQAVYPTPWASRARAVAAAGLATGVVAALSGAAHHFLLGEPAALSVQESAVLVVALGGAAACYAAAFAYVVFASRLHRDPFERNRLRYLGLAVALGSASWAAEARATADWWRDALQISFVLLLTLAMSRRRLLDANRVERFGLVRVVVGIPMSLAYAGSLLLSVTWLGVELSSVAGVAVAALLGLALVLVANGARPRAERLVASVFGGTTADRQAALAEIGRQSAAVKAADELARDLTSRCQAVLESASVAMLLKDDRVGVFSLVGLSGPRPTLQPQWSIAASNAAIERMAEFGGAVTPFVLDELLEERPVPPHELAELGPYRDCIAVPVLARGEPVALLFVAPAMSGRPYTLADLDFLGLVANRAGLSIQNARLYEQLREAAQTDFVTGLPNHRQLQDVFGAALEAAEHRAEPLSVAMVDVDNFKLFNDVHGHQVGDDALRHLATLMAAAIRPGDVVGRYGGDEFLFILPGTTREAASELMAAVARQVQRFSLPTTNSQGAAGEHLPTRISWGLATYPEDGTTRRALVSAADSQLMQGRFESRRSAAVRASKPTTGHFLESDPEKVRVVRGLLDLIEAKDPYTAEHSQQIASFSLLLAEEMRLSDRQRYALWLGSLLHDVGNLGTPPEILRKPGPLTPEEWDEMRKHPDMGEQVVRGLLDIEEVNAIVGCHHERFDGSGYPRGLAGDEIPLMARVVAVADSFSAMVHERPYRRRLSWAEAMVELQKHAGTQFDPEMVQVFLRAVGQSERPAA